MVPLWLIERCHDSVAIHLYVVLMKWANRDRERRAWPSMGQLVEAMQISARSIGRAVHVLKTVGALRTERKRRGDGALLGIDYILIQVEPLPTAALFSLPATGGKKVRAGQGGESPVSIGLDLNATGGNQAGGARPVAERGQETTENGPDFEGVLPATGGNQDPVDLNATGGNQAPDLIATGGSALLPPVAVAYKDQPDPVQPDPRTLQQQSSGSDDATDPVQAFVDAFNDAVDGSPIPPVDILTKTRRRNIRGALVAYPIETWRNLFAILVASDYCTGLGHKHFIATFDWLIATPNPAEQLGSGAYTDPLSPAEIQEAKAIRSQVGWGPNDCGHQPTQCPDIPSCVARVARDQRRFRRRAATA